MMKLQTFDAEAAALAGISPGDLADCLATIAPLELLGLSLFRQSEAHPGNNHNRIADSGAQTAAEACAASVMLDQSSGQWYRPALVRRLPIPAEQLVQATLELIAYADHCHHLIDKLSSLPAVPYPRPILEFPL